MQKWLQMRRFFAHHREEEDKPPELHRDEVLFQQKEAAEVLFHPRLDIRRLQENGTFLSFPYVCPEPVLAK
jgi:hypothetical protein